VEVLRGTRCTVFSALFRLVLTLSRSDHTRFEKGKKENTWLTHILYRTYRSRLSWSHRASTRIPRFFVLFHALGSMRKVSLAMSLP